MANLFKFLFGAIIFGGALSIMCFGFAVIMVSWIGFAGSIFIAMLPFMIIGGFIGVENLD